jgi:hypothetical protein
MRDAYPGDDALPPAATVASEVRRFKYVVTADAEPDALLRVVSQLLLTNTLPQKVLMTRPTPETVVIEVELVGVSAYAAESVQRKLSQLSCAESVCMCTESV